MDSTVSVRVQSSKGTGRCAWLPCCGSGLSLQVGVALVLTLSVFIAAASLAAGAQTELNGCDLNCTKKASGAVLYADDIYTCGGKIGCSPSRKQFYLVKVLIASGILALWMVLAGFYAYFQLRARWESRAYEGDSTELAARVESYRHCTTRKSSFLTRGGAYQSAAACKNESVGSVDSEIPLGMAPTGADFTL